MKAFHTEEYKDHKIELFNDEDPMNPRECDNLGTMVCWHDRYTLGDEQIGRHENAVGHILSEMLIERGLDYVDYDLPLRPLTDELKTHCKNVYSRDEDNHYGFVSYYTFQDFVDDLEHDDDECIAEALERLDGHIITLPLYLYDHSGITMNTTGFGCRWDSGQVGFIWIDIAKTKEAMGWKRFTANRRDHIRSMLKAEVSVYDTYLRGAFCGYVITKDRDDEQFDSCWGYDDTDYAISEAKLYIDTIIKN